MATFVIVHGGGSGGWLWTPVARLLRAAGHEAYTPTLTGSGERVHLATPDTNLSTNILDVVNVMRYERLDDVVLVGSSRGGAMITGVAERVPELINQLIYLDGLVLRDGERIADLLGPEVWEARLQSAKAHGDGWYLPSRPGAERRSPSYIAVFEERLQVTNAAAARLRRTYVRHTSKPTDAPLTRMLDRIAARVRAEEGWNYMERPWPHSPQAEEGGPELVAELLIEIAG